MIAKDEREMHRRQRNADILIEFDLAARASKQDIAIDDERNNRLQD